jgi:hypothetical protein
MFELDIEEIYPDNKHKGSEYGHQPNSSAPVARQKERMKKLQFLKTGTKKYRFILDGEMGLNVMCSKTRMETSWIVQVKNILEAGYVIDLVAYAITLKECNSEGFREMFHITRQFQKLYDEIKVKTDLEGNLLEVLNQKQLCEKWKQIKSETIQYFNDDMNLDEFFAVNDDEFAKPEFLHKLIREVEFFFLYLQSGGYGQKFSSWGLHELKRDNAFRTNTITWDMDFSGEYAIESNSSCGVMNVESRFEPDKKWLQKAYGEMPFIKVEELKPDFNLRGKYVFYNENGWLKEAELEVNEIVHPNQLYHKMKYRIQEIH